MTKDMTKYIKVNIHKIIIGILFVLFLIMYTGIIADAFPIQGYVTSNGGSVNVRKGPGTSYDSLTRLNKGHPVTVVSQSDSNNWFEIEFEEEGVAKKGWMSNTYIRLEIGEYPEFEEYMISQGFPESYKPYLRQLHALHPNWTFEAYHTNLDWNKVIDNQLKLVSRNLVSSSSIASWKSLHPDAYNWDKGTWYPFEPGWVAASSDILKYFMDPRNALVNDGEILQFLTLSWTGIETKSGVENILKGTFMEEDETDYAEIFMEAGKEHKVSPYHLVSRVIQEVGTKGSKSVKGPYYNFYNIGATGSDDPAQDGIEYAKKKGWDTKEKAIIEGAGFIANSYTKAGQDTKYLEKFNVTGGYGDFWHQYMQNIQAPTNEARNMKKNFPNFNSDHFIFKIPVYLNMPEKACPKPTSKADPNYLLSSLKIDNFALTPIFDKHTTTYNVIVPESVSTINISATSVTKPTTIEGTGVINLEPGLNEIKITSTSESGKSIVYNINVSRGTFEYTISTDYKIDNRITGVHPNTAVDKFIENMKSENVTAYVLNSNGSPCTGNVGTGCIVHIKHGEQVVDEHKIVIYGDTNGDGVIDILDLGNVQKHLLGVIELEGIYAEASNTNNDEAGIDILDLGNIQKHLLNVISIQQ